MWMITEDVLLLRRQGSSAVQGKWKIGAVELPDPGCAEGVAAEGEGSGCVGFGEKLDV